LAIGAVTQVNLSERGDIEEDYRPTAILEDEGHEIALRLSCNAFAV
jgi:hypothetical protein